QWVLRHQPLTLLVALATFALTVLLYIAIPKGFFPQQDSGMIQAITQAPASISFTAMAQRQQEAAQIILQDPDVDSVSSFIGVDGTNATLNSGRVQIALKPNKERDASLADISQRLQDALEDHFGSPGTTASGHASGALPAPQAAATTQPPLTVYMQPVQ